MKQMPPLYIAYENLMATGRAAKYVHRRDRDGEHFIIVAHLAGESPRKIYVDFFKKSDAKTARGSLLVGLRERIAAGRVVNDHGYNRVVIAWAEQCMAIEGMTREPEEREENENAVKDPAGE